jgi:hypothetical protein
MSGSPRIVAPTAVRLDERFSVRLVGFPPYRRVTVRARMPLDGRLWESRAVVETDGEGRVDLDEQTPVDGTYEQADAMGLVWSAMRIGDRPAPTAHTKTDGNVSIVTALDGNTVATATVERRFADAGVTVESVDDPDLVADLYEPPGDEPHPGVLLLGGSSGGFPSRRRPAGVRRPGCRVAGHRRPGPEPPTGCRRVVPGRGTRAPDGCPV